jgi:hypothetical protein
MLPCDARLKSNVVRSSLSAQSSGHDAEPSEMAQTEFPHVPTAVGLNDGLEVGFNDDGFAVGKCDGGGVTGCIVGFRVGFFVVGIRVGVLVLVGLGVIGLGVGLAVTGGIVGSLVGVFVIMIEGFKVGFVVGGLTGFPNVMSTSA